MLVFPKKHRGFTEQNYIKREREIEIKRDYELQHLGRIFPLWFSPPHLGLFTTFGKMSP